MNHIESHTISLPKDKKIYFASDQHLGAPNYEASRKREEVFIKWLNEIKADCHSLFIVGDLFDFWFEYRHVIPKGFIRTLGKLAELSDLGIQIYMFTGNHDLWLKDYLTQEINAKVFTSNQIFTINQEKFFIGHGDGLGPNDIGYKLLKKVFTNPLCKWLFKWLHPDLGVQFGQYLSLRNKIISGEENHEYLGDDQEWLVQYCKRKLETDFYNYFIFGHRHLPIHIKIDKSQYVNLGDWINHYTYSIYDGEKLTLEKI